MSLRNPRNAEPQLGPRIHIPISLRRVANFFAACLAFPAPSAAP